jgi:hypothetical protein
VIRAGDTGRRRQAISVAVRAPDQDYETTEATELRVEPGGEVRLHVRVHNESVNPEQLQLVVEGVPDGWAEVYPDRAEVAPGAHAEADITVRFPQARSATWPIRAVVYARGRRVASAPALVHIAPQAVVALEIEPGELRTRRRARTELKITNAGNAAANVELSARDNDGRLGFRVTPARVHIEPGGEARAGVEVSAPRRKWFGPSALTPLMVEAEDGRTRATALGTFQQRSLLPRWTAIVPLLVLAAAAWVVSRPHQVAVPHVTGLSVSEARTKLKQAGLIPKQAPMPAEDPQHPESGVVAQEPNPGEQVKDGDDVTISFEAPGGAATVTPKVDTASVAPPAGETEPLAYVRANRVYARYPGETELEIAGTVGFVSSDPAWNPATGEVAYVRRRSSEAEAEIVAVNPRAPGGERRLTVPGRSYTSPAFSPSGTLLALIAEDGSGYGGEICLETLPADSPGCRSSREWRYSHPVFADDSTFYALRRSTATTRDSGWDELVRFRTDTFAVEDPPLATGDLRSVAVARDGRLAIVIRSPSDASYHVEVLAADGKTTAIESSASGACTVAWSGENLIVSRGSCGGETQIVQLDPRYLDATPTVLVAGDEPSVAP